MSVRMLFASRPGRYLAVLLVGGALCVGCTRSGPSPTQPADSAEARLSKGKQALEKALTSGKVASEKDLDQALVHFTKALAFNPRYPQAYYQRGRAFAAEGLYALACEEFSQALQFQTHYGEAHLEWARALLQLKLYQRAITHAEKAIRINPELGAAYTVLGKAYFHDDPPNYAAAINYLQAARQRDKLFNDEDASLIRQAEEHLTQPASAAIGQPPTEAKYKPPPIKHLFPPHTDPHVKELLEQARAYLANQQFTQAMTAYEEAEKIDPESAEVYYERGCAFLHIGSAYTAIEEFNDALRRLPTYAAALTKRSLALIRTDRCYAAVNDATKAIRLTPADAEPYEYRGRALLKEKKYRQAIDDFEAVQHFDPKRYQRINPELIDAYKGLGKRHISNRRWDAARQALEDAAKLQPQISPSLRALLSQVYRESGREFSKSRDYAQAAARLREAWDYDCEDPENAELLGQTYYKMGNYPAALRYFQEAIRLDPNREYVLQRYVDTAAQRSPAGSASATTVAKPVAD